MKTIFSISILSYFLIGSLILPQGDFSVLPQLPKMYDHCKSVEDAGMNLVDFVFDHLIGIDGSFDHLIGIDGSFDQHENGDHEKPHSTTPFQNQQHQSIYSFALGICEHFISVFHIDSGHNFLNEFIAEEFSPGIFHPPSLLLLFIFDGN